MIALSTAELTGIYTDLHMHPELAFGEHRTAGIVTERLNDWGDEVQTSVATSGRGR